MGVIRCFKIEREYIQLPQIYMSDELDEFMHGFQYFTTLQSALEVFEKIEILILKFGQGFDQTSFYHAVVLEIENLKNQILKGE